MNTLFKYIKFKYLILLSLVALFLNFKFLFIFLFLFFFKFYLRLKKIYFLISAHIFLSFFIIDMVAPKLISNDNTYFIESNIKYSINDKYGYHPIKNKIFEENVYKNNKFLKKTTYTINENGHRISPINNKNYCIFFHGGSITFGQSVNDEETLPYYTYKELDKKFSVFNYGFNGYGPHQFLSKIENNYLETPNICSKTLVIYLFIDDHVGRVVGKRSWGDKSPRYIFNQGEVVQKGFFSDYPFKIIMKMRKSIRNSFTISKIILTDLTTLKDKKLFIRILEKIENEISYNFNDVKFLYIVWNTKKNENQIIYEHFKNKKVLKINDLNIPEKYQKNGIQGDNHPTKEFYEILSRSVAKIVLDFSY